MKRVVSILLICILLSISGYSAGDENKLMVTGDKGEEVVRVQTRLFDLGFYTYKPTGSFRTVTKTAVTAYQAASGLMSDGSVGQETQLALFSRHAKRVDFHAEIPLTYTAQGPITQKGVLLSWNLIRPKLIENELYPIRNAATGEETQLAFASGEHHADMQLPARMMERNSARAMLNKWLGSTNSFYKCSVLFKLDGQWIAASMQWNGDDRICIYFKDSLSHVTGFPDTEHQANIQKAGS